MLLEKVKNIAIAVAFRFMANECSVYRMILNLSYLSNKDLMQQKYKKEFISATIRHRFMPTLFVFPQIAVTLRQTYRQKEKGNRQKENTKKNSNINRKKFSMFE